MNNASNYDDGEFVNFFTTVSLLVYAEYLLHSEITEELGLYPTYHADYDESNRGNMGKTYWCLTSENQINTNDIREHLDWLLNTIYPAKDRIKKLQELRGVSMKISCFLQTSAGGGFAICTHHMKKIYDLNLNLSFSIQCYKQQE